MASLTTTKITKETARVSSTQEVLILLKQMSRDAKIFYIKNMSYLQNLMPVLHNELIK